MASARNNVYTVLLLIAATALLTTVIVLWIQSNSLFGPTTPLSQGIGGNPFHIIEPQQIPR